MQEKVIKVTQKEFEEIIIKTVKNTLTQLGVQHDKPLEMQKDFQHLRNWRESTEAVQRKSLLAIIGCIIFGIVGAVTAGIKMYFS